MHTSRYVFIFISHDKRHRAHLHVMQMFENKNKDNVPVSNDWWKRHLWKKKFKLLNSVLITNEQVTLQSKGWLNKHIHKRRAHSANHFARLSALDFKCILNDLRNIKIRENCVSDSTFKHTAISVVVVSKPQKALQSFATRPEAMTSLPLLIVPATSGTWTWGKWAKKDIQIPHLQQRWEFLQLCETSAWMH